MNFPKTDVESLPTNSNLPTPPRPQLTSLTPSRRRDLFGGHGEVQIWSLLHPNALDPFKAALWCELEPSGVVGRHLQQHYPEILICLAGEGIIKIGQQTHTFVPGVCLTLPLGEILEITCGERLPLSYMIIKAEQS